MNAPVTPMPVLHFESVSRTFQQGGKQTVHALVEVSFGVHPQEIVAVIGPSGAGKTTLANIALGLDRPTGGTLRWGGEDVRGLRRGALRQAKRANRLVTQDPFGALHPGMTVFDVVSEPLRGSALDRAAWAPAVHSALENVGLDPSAYGRRYPHQLSGGQRQRVAIARATVGAPRLIVADEPTSMLDVSVRASINSLLRNIRDERAVGILLITHDLGIARYIADRVVVLDRGRVVESGPADQVFSQPEAPMTRALIDAAL